MAFTCVLHLLWRAFPRVQKAVVGAYSCWRLCTILWPCLRCPQLQHFCWRCTPPTWKSLRKSDHLPWYNYLLAVFIFALGSLRFVVGSLSHHAGKMDTLGLLFSIGIFFLQPVQNLAWAVYSGD